MSRYSVGEITSMIKKMTKMDLAELGSDENVQNTYIWYYMTLAMWKFVSLAYVMRVSDPLTVTENGFVTFKRGGSDIDDLYEQVRILDSNGQEVKHRSSFTAPSGWWRDSISSQIHIKGAGTYTMHYKAYPTKVTAAAQALEWPGTSYELLMYQTIGMVKESRNDIQGAQADYATADKLIPVLIKANIDAQGMNGRTPSMDDLQFYRR